MSDLRSSNLFDLLDEDGGASAPAPAKKETKPADKASSKKVDAPPKKEKPSKNEEPAAPVGKDQRGAGGRESKPRGRGRDNKMGLRKPAGSGREFDRRSGPAATHRNAPHASKRQDKGAHNWGDAVEEGTIAATTEVQPASPPPAEENKAEPTAENKNAEQKEEAKPEEEEDKNITYDQYLKKKQSSTPADDKLEARAVEIKDKDWRATAPVQSEKKKKPAASQSRAPSSTDDDKEDEEKSEKTSKKKKKTVFTLDQFVASGPVARPTRESRPPRSESSGTSGEQQQQRGGGAGGERGRGRGGRGVPRGAGAARGAPRGRGRGRGGGDHHGHSSSDGALKMDESSFPKLGK